MLVIVAIGLGAILLARGGGIGFDQDDASVDIGEGSSEPTTTAAPVETTAAPQTVPPSEVAVVAANGAGISGLAGNTAEFLATQGYTNVVTTDAPSDVSATVVYFAEGFEPNAAAIAALFGLPEAQIQPLPTSVVANNQPADTAVVLAIGPDSQAVIEGATTTTTTG